MLLAPTPGETIRDVATSSVLSVVRGQKEQQNSSKEDDHKTSLELIVSLEEASLDVAILRPLDPTHLHVFSAMARFVLLLVMGVAIVVCLPSLSHATLSKSDRKTAKKRAGSAPKKEEVSLGHQTKSIVN